MKYFFLTSDEENPLPHILNLHEQINTMFLNKQDASKLERFHALYVKPNLETLYADVLTHPIFMVTKGVAEVMSYYYTSIEYKIAALFSLETGVGKVYYIPILDQIDCLAEGSEFNRDHGVILRAVMDPEKTMGKAIFKLAGIKKTYIVARLDFAESLLRRRALGLKLEEIELVSR